jgi:HipA-like protein
MKNRRAEVRLDGQSVGVIRESGRQTEFRYSDEWVANPSAVPVSLALPIGGKTDNLKRKHWLAFAKDCQLPEKAADRVLMAQAAALPEAARLLERCYLPDEQKAAYRQLLEERSAQLASSDAGSSASA